MKNTFEINEKSHSSSAYLGTVKHHTLEGKLIIDALRREWKHRFAHTDENYRVVLKGRLGKDNPNAHKYSRAKYGWKGLGFGGHSHQNIRLEDAAYADLYAYKRY